MTVKKAPIKKVTPTEGKGKETSPDQKFTAPKIPSPDTGNENKARDKQIG